MKLNYSPFLVFLLFFCHTAGFSEGTKELMPDVSNPTRILLDPASGRVPFALYSSRTNPDYRLFIRIENPATEKIYFGMGQQRNSNNDPIETRITWRIHPPNSPDITECTGLTPINNNLPTPPSPGYISEYIKAFNGPDIVNPNGYDALVCSPTNGAGDYFMTFESNSTRTFDFLDITVVDISTTPPSIKPGRVFSKCWQIRNPSYGWSNYYTFHGNLYIYSTDGIVTKINPNGMEGRDFAVSCNESGCYPIGPTMNASQARQSQPGPNPHNYPQYKIFLNNPDILIYPDGVIGQLVDGSLTTETFCNSGTVKFGFQTTPANAIGTVEITLTLSALSPPMEDLILITNNIPGGMYSIEWDGKDGLGNQVPNGSTFPFTLRYTNGLTHMPLWDVEDNINGFIVNLIRPQQSPPLPNPAFYWDDRMVNGNFLVDSPGCTVPTYSSCHAWSGNWGDQKTINTWWYLVSNSTQPSLLIYKKNPSSLTFINPPNQVCPGATVTFTVNPDVNSTSYFWVWDGGNQTTTTNSIAISFPSNLTPGSSSIIVNGINSQCGNGPTSTLPITIKPIPVLTTSLTFGTCSGVAFTIPLTSSTTGASFSWTTPTCSANIALPLPVAGSGNPLTGSLSVSDLLGGTVTYPITPMANGCSGEIKNLVVTVDPKPNITSPSLPSENLCSGGSTNIVLQSGLAGAAIDWQVLPGGCTNIRIMDCPTSGSTSPIVNLLTLSDNSLPGSVVYTITPSLGGCSGNAVPHTVNVLPLPPVALSPFTDVCLNTPEFTLTGGTPTGGTYKLNGTTVTTFNPSAAGVGTFPITYTYFDGNCTKSDQKNIFVQDLITPNIYGDASACVGVSETFTTSNTGVPSSYTWNVTPDGTIVAGSNPWEKIITWNNAVPSTKNITVIYTDPNGCATTPGSLSVPVNPLPTPTLVSPSINVCNQRPYTYTTQPLMQSYDWAASPGNTITFTGNTATVTWNTISNAEWIRVNYVNANGCTAVAPTSYPVIVNPTPLFVVTGDPSVCAGSTSTYKLQGTEKGNWTITPGGSITPPATNVNSISVNWVSGTSPASSSIDVTYTNTLGCAGTTATNVNIQPLPITTFTSSTPSPVCQDFPTPYLYTVDAGGAASTYHWQVNPSGSAVIDDPMANPAAITWKLTGTTPQTAQLSLTATTSETTPACSAPSSPVTITINPKPNTQLLSGFDLVTSRSAKKFLLKGGTPLLTSTPLQGEYLISPPTSALTFDDPNYYFDPAMVSGNLPVTFDISYKYTSSRYGCPATSAPITITVLGLNPPCGSTLYDYRNRITYRTSSTLVPGKCWMVENLRYGQAPPTATAPQTDNCIVERNCLSSDPTCVAYGGLYQWDELIQYGSTDGPAYQGVCPPGWHIPSSTEWTDLINAVVNLPGVAGDGLAGSYLKDQNLANGFDALVNGIYYLDNVWAYTTGNVTGTMFWTSTQDPNSSERMVARGVNNINYSASNYPASRANAFPVRCVKD